MPMRSASWAASTRRPLCWRSRSSRSSIRLKAATTRPISSLAADGQALTRPQQVDRLHPLGQPLERRRPRVAAAGRSRPRVTTSPPTTISACVGLIGASISTGLNSSSAATAPSSPALTAKTRQKSERATSHQLDVSAASHVIARHGLAAPSAAARSATGTGVSVSSWSASLLSRPRRSRPRARDADDDQVGGLLGRDLAEKRRRVARPERCSALPATPYSAASRATRRAAPSRLALIETLSAPSASAAVARCRRAHGRARGAGRAAR